MLSSLCFRIINLSLKPSQPPFRKGGRGGISIILWHSQSSLSRELGFFPSPSPRLTSWQFHPRSTPYPIDPLGSSSVLISPLSSHCGAGRQNRRSEEGESHR